MWFDVVQYSFFFSKSLLFLLSLKGLILKENDSVNLIRASEKKILVSVLKRQKDSYLQDDTASNDFDGALHCDGYRDTEILDHLCR